jgi:hypothetical protein
MPEQIAEDRRHLDHFAWLEREGRHTTLSDRALIRALDIGWCVTEPGIMPEPHWVRVRLTQSGRDRLRETAANVR